VKMTGGSNCITVITYCSCEEALEELSGAWITCLMRYAI
jgi:hypothetical protein